jgi:protein O-mannosyl-transferase
VLEYITKLFLPFHLSIFYPYPRLADGHLPYFYYVSPVIVALLFYGVYRSLKYGRLITFGALFFIVNLILVLQFLSIGDAIMAERYTYVPYIGLFFILAMGFDRFYHSQNVKFKPYKSFALVAVVAIAVAFAGLTYTRCQVWENDVTIADDLMEKYPDDRLALNNKGFLLFNQRRYDEAVKFFNKAIRQRPDYTMAYINLVNVYITTNNYDHALATTDSAIKNIPNDYNLLNARGFLLLNQKKYPEAIVALKAALAVKKENINSYLYLAQCYYNMQDYATEIATLDEGLKHDPANYILLNNKGYALFTIKHYDEAIGYFQESLKIKPGYSIASANLTNCYKAIDDSLKRGK